jgi:hypothetical protein
MAVAIHLDYLLVWVVAVKDPLEQITLEQLVLD